MEALIKLWSLMYLSQADREGKTEQQQKQRQ
jgi:hypothetical protein